MSAKNLICIAAVLILIHLLGHAVGHFSWDDSAGPLFEVVKLMKSKSADFMGATKSLADYYHGYSMIMFGLYGMSIAILLILANHTSSKMTRQLLIPIGITYVFFGIIECLYFFPFAAAVSFLAGLLILFSVLKLNNNQ